MLALPAEHPLCEVDLLQEFPIQLTLTLQRSDSCLGRENKFAEPILIHRAATLQRNHGSRPSCANPLKQLTRTILRHNGA